MEMLDKVFLVIFARNRRKKGDSNLESAWYLASYKMSAYIGWPVAAATLVLAAATYALTRAGSPSAHKHLGELMAAAVWLMAAYLLDRRFRKYLSNPPTLTSQESPHEWRLVVGFRAASLGFFALTCLVGFLLHRAGFHFIQGF